MTPHEAHVRAIFDEALDGDASDWPALLTRRCGVDRALHEDVSRLLRWHADSREFLVALESRDGDTDAASGVFVGQCAGAYRLTEVIGRGGMATVYKAVRDDGLYDQVVAVKILNRLDVPVYLARRVQQERKALASLAHPNITRLIDAGELASGDPYLVMEWVDGVSIVKHCEARQLSVSERLGLFLQVCDATIAAHRRAMLHRDLKPSNILVTRDGHVKLLDFGLARSLTDQESVTRSVQWLTPAYASPEQLRDDTLTTASDVYTLAVVLFEMLTGALPYPSNRAIPVAVTHDIVSGNTRRLRHVSPGMPHDLDAILARALELEPARRFQTVEQFRDDVERYLSGRPVTARTGRWTYRLRRFVQRHAAMVAVALCVAFVFVVAVAIAVERGWAAWREADLNRTLLYQAEMRLAAEAFDAGNTGELAALLALQVPQQGAPDLRGFEWYLLQHAAAPDAIRVPVSSIVTGVAWSPDERFVATTDRAGQVLLWNPDDWRPRTLGQHAGVAWKVAFMPGGQSLVSVGSDGFLRVWSVAEDRPASTVASPAPTVEVKVHERAARAVAITPDGRTVVTGGDDGRVVSRLLAEPTRERVLSTSAGLVRSLDISRDGRWLAAAADAGVALLWSMDDEGAPRVLRAGSNLVNAVRFSHDSKVLVASSESGIVVQWDLVTGARMQSDHVDEGMMESVEIAPGIGTILGAHGPWVTQWDDEDWDIVGRMAAHDGRVVSMALSPTGSRLLTSGSDRSLKIWPLTRGTPSPWLLGHTRDVWRVTFSRDGRYLASGSTDGTVRLWDTTGPREPMILQSGVGTAKGVAFAGREHVVMGTEDGRIIVWDGRTGERIDERQAHRHQVLGLDVSPDERLVAVSTEDGTASVWALNSLVEQFRVSHESRVVTVTFSPDGCCIATSSDDGTAAVWSAESGELRGRLIGHEDSVYAVAYSPDGAYLATSSSDRTIRIWSALSHQLVRVLTGHADRIWSVAFSPDGRRLASASSDTTVKIWDAGTGRELVSLRGPSTWRHVAFAPDGQQLAAGSASGLVALWAAPRSGVVAR